MIKKIFEYCEGGLSNEELKELYKWVNKNERNRTLFIEIKNYYAFNSSLKAKRLSRSQKEKLLEEIYQREGWYRKVVFRPKPAALALQLSLSVAVLFFVIIGLVQLHRYNKEREAQEYLAANIRSADKKAVLTLSTGEEMLLGVKESKGKSGNYEVVDDGSKVVINTNKEPKTNPLAKERTVVNTIATELGGVYSAVLPDGSEVWLNSKSKLSFTNDFGAQERRVKLEGEAFFWVKKSTQLPFVVEMGGQSVEVLGTNFNIKAYNEEKYKTVSLVEGAVRFCDNISGKTKELSPNRELLIDSDSGDFIEREFDPYVYKAWHEGYFLFADEELNEILVKMSRWFNIEIKLESDEYDNMRFNGKISSKMGIMPLMSQLQLSYKFRYYIEDNVLIIK